ncbi:MAG TPA: serine--tRNA ligase, partial [Anaerolineales bacterium]|nr:serine--tRNA ligase [Anaerolineales bacterium]
MLDINIIRDHPDVVRKALADRQDDPAPVDQILELDRQRRQTIQETESLKAERNTVSKEISKAKDPTERQAKIEAMRQVGERISQLDEILRKIEADLNAILAGIPNIPDERTPYGKDDSENVVLHGVGAIPEYDFQPKAHWDLGPALGILDFERGVKITGSRFYVLSGAGARLQRALIAWMLDLHIRQGYTEKYTPFMVKQQTMFSAGQLPKFEDNLYHDVEDDLWMVPTAEVPLTGLHMDDVIEVAKLPI